MINLPREKTSGRHSQVSTQDILINFELFQGRRAVSDDEEKFFSERYSSISSPKHMSTTMSPYKQPLHRQKMTII